MKVTAFRAIQPCSLVEVDRSEKFLNITKECREKNANDLVELLTLQLRIREVPVSILGPETGYPCRQFRGFPQSLQSNACAGT
jgi:hypothetical protein